MSDTIIKVSNLGKKYRIRLASETHTGFRHVVQSALSKPFRRLLKRSDPVAVPENRSQEFWALREISFEIQRGEVIGFLGRNGAGKSTLLKILSRITEPTEGRVEISGRVASLLEVGTGFHPELTGRENVFLNGTILGMSRREIRSKFDEIVAFAETEKFLDTPVKYYSSGMYVRLAFAVAAHLEPDILIVDEVLAVGDASFQKKCLGKMRDVSQQQGRTVLFVSHNMTPIAALCSRAVYLNAGRLQMIGDARAAIDTYMGAGIGQQTDTVWHNVQTAPGSRNVRLHAVRVVSEGSTSTDVPIDKEIVIEVEYWVLRPNLHLNISIELLDQYYTPVLTGSNFPSSAFGMDAHRDQHCAEGLFRTRCVLPPNFLNNRGYRVHVVLLREVAHVEARVDDVISFSVYDTGVTSKEFVGGWPGVLRPKLEWGTEQIDGLPDFSPEQLEYPTAAGKKPLGAPSF